MNKNNNKWLQKAPHILFGVVVLSVLVILLSKVFNFLDGDVLDFGDWEDDPNEIVYENSDFILPLMLDKDSGWVDDGELNVLCLGNHPFSDERDSDTNVCNMVAELTDANVYNCSFPSSTLSAHDATYNASAYLFDAFSFYHVTKALCTGDMTIYDEFKNALPVIPEGIPDPHEILSGIDMNKIDIIAIMYDGMDYLDARRVNDDEDPMNVSTYLGSFNTAIDMLQETYPHIRIIVMSPTYCFGVLSDGSYISSDIQSYGNEFLSTFSIKLSEASYQQSVSFVDNLYGTIHENIAEDYLLNNLHLNEDGRRLVAERLADAINKYPTPHIQ